MPVAADSFAGEHSQRKEAGKSASIYAYEFPSPAKLSDREIRHSNVCALGACGPFPGNRQTMLMSIHDKSHAWPY